MLQTPLHPHILYDTEHGWAEKQTICIPPSYLGDLETFASILRPCIIANCTFLRIAVPDIPLFKLHNPLKAIVNHFINIIFVYS